MYNRKFFIALGCIFLLACVILIIKIQSTPKKQGVKILPTPAIATSASNKEATTTCKDFSAFSNYVMNTIQKPDLQENMQMNPYVITSFKWKRETTKPFETYPIIKGTQAFYDGIQDSQVNYNESLVTIIKNDSSLLAKTLEAKANELGFNSNPLNSQPLKTFANKNTQQLIAFQKNDDIYSIVLASEWGKQAVGQSTVTVTCGRIISEFEHFYDALNSKSDTSVEDSYNNDYISISDVNPDKTVYALVGSANRISIAEYYSFDSKTLKLITKNSYPAACEPLELLKIGRGMRCTDGNGQRTVK